MPMILPHCCLRLGLCWPRSALSRPLQAKTPLFLRLRQQVFSSRASRPLRKGRVLVQLRAAAGVSTLGAAAFVALSQQQDDDHGDNHHGDDDVLSGHGKGRSREERARQHAGTTPSGDPTDTSELRMLEASQSELLLHVSDGVRTVDGVVGQAIVWLDLYVLEPILTALRFFHLVAIFAPVAAAVPAIWIGSRVPLKSGDAKGRRTGTLWWFRYLVASMELAGPAFIKLGQWAASRPDIFPAELCELMSKLHSNAPAHSMKETRQILKRVFAGRALNDIFTNFEESPIGVGAIAQVYRARLNFGVVQSLAQDTKKELASNEAPSRTDRSLDSNEEVNARGPLVAVKVIHPRAERTVRRDLRIMAFFAAMLNVIPTIEWLSLPDEVAQFGLMMRLQLDLRIEAANLARLRHNFRDRTTVQFPYPYVDLTSRDVLIEEFAHGIPLADFLNLGGGVYNRLIAHEGLDAFLRMVILDNFIHADLHPGNIMLRFYRGSPPLPRFNSVSSSSPSASRSPSNLSALSSRWRQGDSEDVTEQALKSLLPLRDQNNPQAWQGELARLEAQNIRPQLLFLDAGLVTELNAGNRRDFLDLFRAVADFDGHRAGELMCRRCRQPEAVLSPDVFALRMQHLVLNVRNHTLALGNVRVGDILREVLSMVRQHHVRLEGDYVNVVISILLLEGAGRALSPDVDLLSSALPILREVGTRDAAGLAKSGDFSLLLLWAGLEARSLVQASIEDVERGVKYDLLSPNV